MDNLAVIEKHELWLQSQLFLQLTFSSHCPSAKQKLEDRLAAAAREKLAQASKESKEKQLQAERKRKAALFLQTLRGPVPGEPEAKRVELDSCTQLEVGEWLMEIDRFSLYIVSWPNHRLALELNPQFLQFILRY